MVQELQVLRCFSCETFQTQIVKKTNKWECKICGVKQSVKKVYGRGSGKDCRIHTQKLNALRGQKKETESPNQQAIEISDPELSVSCVPTNDHPSPTNPSVVQRASKWAEFIDEIDTGVKQNYLTPTTTQKCKVQKRKMRDEFVNKDFLGDFDSADDFYNKTINAQPSRIVNKTKFNKYNTTKNNSYKNYNVDRDYNKQRIYRESVDSVNNAHFKNDFKNQNNSELSENWVGCVENEEPNMVKISSNNTINIRQQDSNVSLKWAKYLDDEDLSSEEVPSPITRDTDNQLESEIGVSLKKTKYSEVSIEKERNIQSCGFVTQDHFGKVSSDVCGRAFSVDLGKVNLNQSGDISSNNIISSSKSEKSSEPNLKIWLNDSVSTLKEKSLYHTNTNKFYSNSNDFDINITSRGEAPKNKFDKEVDKSVKRLEEISTTVSSLPVFEQNYEFSDSDFQLDF